MEGKTLECNQYVFFDHVYIVHFQEINFAYQNRHSKMHIYMLL